MLEVRAGGVRSIGRFAAVVNCSGAARLPAAAPAVARDLLDAGLARPGPHRLGLDVDPDGRVVGADGSVHPRLWVLGPLRRGVLWETTAVPEIRTQARRLAADVRELRTARTLVAA
jgi:uncharacterized NAD(P)/FAD-binding protein YdhS